MTFVGTRFEDFSGFLYLGCWTRGSILTTDVAIFMPGFATSGQLQDVDLDIYACVDRRGAFNAVQVAGVIPANVGIKPRNVSIRLHTSATKYAQTAGGYFSAGLALTGIIDADTCNFTVDGVASSPYTSDIAVYPGYQRPLVTVSGFKKTSENYLYFNTDQVLTPGTDDIYLVPNSAGIFKLSFSAATTHSEGQLFTLRYGGGDPTRRLAFPRQ